MFAVGCHMSIGKGVVAAIEAMKAMNGGIIQIFVTPPIGKASKDMVKRYTSNSSDILQACVSNNVQIVIHSPYTYNFARTFEKDSWWVKALWNELLVSNVIGSIGCVIHVGKHLELSVEEGKKNMLNALKYLIEQMHEAKLQTKIILETAAGQGTELLRNIKDFLDFYNSFTKQEKDYIRLCIDTCHVFAAGNDISSEDMAMDLFTLIHKEVGLEYVALIHLNDSKSKCNSGVDRHENIGKGHIGTKPLMQVVQIAKKHGIPIVLETPDEGLYKKEISEILQTLN